MAVQEVACPVCGTRFIPTPRRAVTCSQSCRGALGGTAPSKRICSCGKPASKRGWCRDCSHERKLASRRAHYRRYAQEISRKTKERRAALSPEIKERRQRLNAERRFNGLRQLRLEQDGYACQHCGCGDNLVIHHQRKIARAAPARRDRSDRESGIDDLLTLCRACHARLHLSLRDVMAPHE